jgi:hypothetical protein
MERSTMSRLFAVIEIVAVLTAPMAIPPEF